MLADNLGSGDLATYGGGEIRGMPTPRLDQLANQGVRFTQSPPSSTTAAPMKLPSMKSNVSGFDGKQLHQPRNVNMGIDDDNGAVRTRWFVLEALDDTTECPIEEAAFEVGVGGATEQEKPA